MSVTVPVSRIRPDMQKRRVCVVVADSKSLCDSGFSEGNIISEKTVTKRQQKRLGKKWREVIGEK